MKFSSPYLLILAIVIFISACNRQSNNMREQPKSNTVALNSQQEGENKGLSVFKKNNCGLCHKEDKTLIGPSVVDIKSTYEGKEKELLAFLKGETQPLMEAEKYSQMAPSIALFKKLKEEDQLALVNFLLKGGGDPK